MIIFIEEKLRLEAKKDEIENSDQSGAKEWNDLSILYFKLGYYEEALESCNTAIGMDSDNQLLLYNKAIILCKLESYVSSYNIFMLLCDIEGFSDSIENFLSELEERVGRLNSDNYKDDAIDSKGLTGESYSSDETEYVCKL